MPALGGLCLCLTELNTMQLREPILGADDSRQHRLPASKLFSLALLLFGRASPQKLGQALGVEQLRLLLRRLG